jgi:hypothetical protein
VSEGTKKRSEVSDCRRPQTLLPSGFVICQKLRARFFEILMYGYLVWDFAKWKIFALGESKSIVSLRGIATSRRA